MVIEQKKLYFSHQFIFSLPNIVLLHLEGAFDVVEEELGVLQLLGCLSAALVDHPCHFPILQIELILYFGESFINCINLSFHI